MMAMFSFPPLSSSLFITWSASALSTEEMSHLLRPHKGCRKTVLAVSKHWIDSNYNDFHTCELTSCFVVSNILVLKVSINVSVVE